jgi:hypothetical protein
MTEIERDGTAPEVPATEPQPDGEEHIYLPGLLSDEFGISRGDAENEIRLGTTTIDKKPYEFTTSTLTIPKSRCVGKTIEVKGGNYRTFRVKVPE